MAAGILIALIGLCVAGLAAVVGIWMERDVRRPKHWAFSLTALILLATVVSMVQSYLDAIASAKLEDDMARMLAQLEKLASGDDGDNTALSAFISKEVQAQSRANPEVVDKLADRVTAEGGDASEMLGKHLPASDLKKVKKSKKGKAASAAVQAKLKEAQRKLKQKEEKIAELKKKKEEAAKKAEKAEEEKAQAAEQNAQLEEKVEKLKEKLKKAKAGKRSQVTAKHWNQKG